MYPAFVSLRFNHIGEIKLLSMWDFALTTSVRTISNNGVIVTFVAFRNLVSFIHKYFKM